MVGQKTLDKGGDRNFLRTCRGPLRSDSGRKLDNQRIF